MEYCPLFSGSSGNAAYIASGKTSLLLDAGMSSAALCGALAQISADPAALSAVLITHEHADHVKGVGPFVRRFGMPVYANAATWQAMRHTLGSIPAHCVRVFETGRAFMLGGINVTPFAVPHDAAEPVGYTFESGGAKLCHMTDLGCITETVLCAAERSDMVMLESNHDVRMLQTGPYPAYLKKRILSDQGHLSNDAACDAMAKLLDRCCGRFVLGHLSQENNDEDIAYRTVMEGLARKGVTHFPTVYVARRQAPTALFQMV